MPRLVRALQNWEGDTLAVILTDEIKQLSMETLPLQQAVSPGSYVDVQNLGLSLLSRQACDEAVRLRVGVFFTEIVASCGCGDEPMHLNAYCELDISIKRTTAEATFAFTEG